MIFNPAGLTLPVETAKSISQVVFENNFTALEANKLSMFIDYNNGIKANMKIVTAGTLSGLAGYNRTQCGELGAVTIGASEKEWAPKYISDRFKECYINLLPTFWKYTLKNGVEKPNLEDTDYEAFVLRRLREYMNEMLMYRLIFFTDTAIAAGVNNSITAPQLKYFNTNDGVIKQLQAIAAATPARRTTIAKNAGATYAAQAFDAADITAQVATGYLTELVYKAHMDLRRVPVSERIILCTQTIADQYAMERKSVTGLDLAYTRIENGMDTFKIDGVTILPLPTIDALIEGYYNNGTKFLFGPHFALHTTKNNIMVGTEETSNFSELKSHFSEDSEEWFVKFGFNFDVKIGVDRLCQVAY